MPQRWLLWRTLIVSSAPSLPGPCTLAPPVPQTQPLGLSPGTATCGPVLSCSMLTTLKSVTQVFFLNLQLCIQLSISGLQGGPPSPAPLVNGAPALPMCGFPARSIATPCQGSPALPPSSVSRDIYCGHRPVSLVGLRPAHPGSCPLPLVRLKNFSRTQVGLRRFPSKTLNASGRKADACEALQQTCHTPQLCEPCLGHQHPQHPPLWPVHTRLRVHRSRFQMQARGRCSPSDFLGCPGDSPLPSPPLLGLHSLL